MNDAENGSNGKSRLDRIEAALELMIADHEEFRAEHKMLLKSQVLMQDAMEKSFAKSRQRMDEMEDKLNGVIGVVDQLGHRVGEIGRHVDQLSQDVAAMRADTDFRLRRLEDRA
ncbi:MAG: hypothetical protein L0Y42_10145 [Phycisphaerales bacterium]|nr:hypothetical protein [Phycisphaerales bacterium]